MMHKSPYYEQLLSYWKSLCTDDQIPTSSMFNPVKIPRSLKNLTLWEMDREDKIRCRLAGTAVVDRMGTDMTGAELTDIMGAEARALITTDFRAMLHHRCGVWYAIINRHPTGKVAVANSLILPLSPEKGGWPKFVIMHGPGDTLAYEPEGAKLELGRSFHERAYIDMGWGAPSLEG